MRPALATQNCRNIPIVLLIILVCWGLIYFALPEKDDVRSKQTNPIPPVIIQEKSPNVSSHSNSTNRPLPPVWMYCTGNLRTFRQSVKSLSAFIKMMDWPVNVVMHTWDSWQHSSPSHDNKGRVEVDINQREEILQVLASPEQNLLLKYASSFRAQVDHYADHKAAINAPSPSTNTACTIFYSWKLAHAAAMSSPSPPTLPHDVIIRVRPDISFSESIEISPVVKYLKKHPRTMIAHYHADSDEYRKKLLSDNFWVTSKLVLDLLSATNFSQWIRENIRPEDDSWSTETYFYRLLEQLEVKLVWIPSRFRIQRDDRTVSWPDNDPPYLDIFGKHPSTQVVSILSAAAERENSLEDL